MKKALFLILLSAILFTCSEDPDPCEAMTCNNGGHCEDGSCVCAEGWTGSFCNKRKDPTTIIISKIVVTKFPPKTSGGANWDASDGPDIYGAVYDDNELLLRATGIISNATTTPLTWSATTEEQKLHLSASERYTFELWDDDGSSDQWMGGIIGYLYDEEDDMPSEIVFTAVGASVSYTFTVEYGFE
jgi:hypothetical protein